jgi:hypothetical protein
VIRRTAVSSGEVNSRISVHRLEQRMVPRFCWLDLRLQASLYSMYGLPVSTCGDTEQQRLWHQQGCMATFPCGLAMLRLHSQASAPTAHLSAQAGLSVHSASKR